MDGWLSPSEFLKGRQIPIRVDALVPSPTQAAQGKQARQASKSQQNEKSITVNATTYQYRVGAPCYTLYFSPKWNKNPRWILAVTVKVYGTWSVNARVLPRGPTWRRQVDQLRPRFGADQDKDPGDGPAKTMSAQFNQPQTDSPRIQVPPVQQPLHHQKWR